MAFAITIIYLWYFKLGPGKGYKLAIVPINAMVIKRRSSNQNLQQEQKRQISTMSTGVSDLSTFRVRQPTENEQLNNQEVQQQLNNSGKVKVNQRLEKTNSDGHNNGNVFQTIGNKQFNNPMAQNNQTVNHVEPISNNEGSLRNQPIMQQANQTKPVTIDRFSNSPVDPTDVPSC
ncbi:hypothetical protein RDWZM_006558 [Blomia tropicalis]|uniref:Uncharacterized protein n=1 Tax=Blomia tropicalis TaxID=40697 RepID=A0A9Q0RNI3_BLOTA|nr:hypothetical protein RDWZM_006558 [Blomia tropicalis]